MQEFKSGQRWISEAEPELGLGIITDVQSKMLVVEFRSSQTHRSYGIKTAPLKRVVFKEGEVIHHGEQNEKLNVVEVKEVDGLLTYITESGEIHESDISHHISFNKPHEKLYNGLISTNDHFKLRIETLKHVENYEGSDVKGLIGGRMSLLAHQFYVAKKILKEPLPRVLLADEVGLGKTIEAGLCIQNLLKTGRASRVLVLVPDSLVYQWFLEMRRKFNLSFATVNQETHIEEGMNPFLDNELVVASLDLLRGAQKARDFLNVSDFDVLVVDEAHQLKWTKEGPDLAFSIVEEVAKRVPMAFLLTATPEQLGQTGHFARLKLLDGNRFYDYKAFKKESEHFHEIAQITKAILSGLDLSSEHTALLTDLGIDQTKDKEEVLSDLLDRHGTGRILFRNSRANLAGDYDFFPKRMLKAYCMNAKTEGSYKEVGLIDALFYEKAMWLCEFLQKNNDKVLLICKSKTKVIELEKFLKENVSSIKTGVFHSDLSLMARDRGAAYFADKDGAQVLLCTEIGSEGRNFEFCHHLVLFDLPISVDLLEQRIGRLDRIGQKFDINIHVPYGVGSYEEVLYRWYHEGLNAFEKNCKVGLEVLSNVREDLINALEGNGNLDELIGRTCEISSELEKKLEEGRDQLIEYNSYNHDEAFKMIAKLKACDKDHSLQDYLESVFHHLGVDSEDLDPFTTYIHPSDNMLLPHFPTLDSDGKRMTFERSVALSREDVEFMSWDHPMVSGVIELILSEGVGNMCVAQRKGGKSTGKVYLECFFALRSLTRRGLDTAKYLPTKTIRVLINPQGEVFTDKWSKDMLDDLVEDASVDNKKKAMSFPRDKVEAVLEKARAIAEGDANSAIANAKDYAMKDLGHEIQRLENLKKLNPSVRDTEIEFLKSNLRETLELIGKSEITFDSLRIII